MDKALSQHDTGTSRHYIPKVGHIRLADLADIDHILTVSNSATRKFSSIPELADLGEDRESPESVQSWLDLGRVYVFIEEEHAIGIVAAQPMDDVLYIAEISVHLDHQREGIGGRLLGAVFEWALDLSREAGATTARVSLTTYADLSWNGPWYQKHGFREVDASEIGPEHIQKMEKDSKERDLVRPGYRRCCMLWEAEADSS